MSRARLSDHTGGPCEAINGTFEDFLAAFPHMEVKEIEATAICFGAFWPRASSSCASRKGRRLSRAR